MSRGDRNRSKGASTVRESVDGLGKSKSLNATGDMWTTAAVTLSDVGGLGLILLDAESDMFFLAKSNTAFSSS